MADTTDFNEEDDTIFSDEDIAQDPLSKGNRLIPTGITSDFIAWLARYHPEITMLKGIPLRKLEALVDEFEYFYSCNYDFTPQEWRFNLERR